MDSAVLIARVVIAATLILAGVGKLLDRSGTRNAVASFGVPDKYVGLIARVLPFAELAAGIALLPSVSSLGGSIAATALLFVFTFVVARAVARGEAPDCHCFGQIHSEPVSARTLGRNAALTVVSGFALVAGLSHPGPSAVAWLGHQPAAWIVADLAGVVIVTMLAFQAWFSIELLKQIGAILTRLDVSENGAREALPAPARRVPPPQVGLTAGSTAPAFELPNVDGKLVSLNALRSAQTPVLLIFTDPHCGPCNMLMPSIGDWQRGRARDLTIALISRGSVEENRAKAAEHGLSNLLLQDDRELMVKYRASATPSAYLVTAEGRIADRLAQGPQEISLLVATAAAKRILDVIPATTAGQTTSTSPDLPQLLDAAGERISLGAYAGHDLVVLFWNPGCGFCERMLPDLEAWERSRSDDDPNLILVSTSPLGDVGLRARVAIDKAFTAAHALGANGTPSAIRITPAGIPEARPAIGADAVLSLLRSSRRPGLPAMDGAAGSHEKEISQR